MSRHKSHVYQEKIPEKERKMLNTARYRLRKKEKGRCTLCPELAIQGRRCCQKCLDKEKVKRDYKRLNKLCLSCAEPTFNNSVRCGMCKEKGKQHNRTLKKKVLDHYGHKCLCECGCQVTRFNHLTIDHVNNDGKEHRKKGFMGRTLYLWILKNNFPSSIQVLCWNCNCAKQHFGGCD